MSATPSRRLRASVRAVVVLALLMLTPCVPAQRVIQFSTGGPGGGGAMSGPPVTSREVERYAAIVGMDEAQLADVQQMHEGFLADFGAAREAMMDRMRELTAEAQETGDHAILIEELPPVMDEFRERSETLRDGFFEDFRLVLTPAQDARWLAVERVRRRERTLANGELPGESVDLAALAGELEVPAPASGEVATLLERYELDLDRALQDRNAILDERPGLSGGGGFVSINAEDLAEWAERRNEAGARVQDVNRRYARQIESALGGPAGAAFADAFQRASYPQVYRASYASRVIDATGGFDDLTDAQQAELETLRATYERELAAVNEAWAGAIDETSGEDAGLGFRRVMLGGQEDDGPVAEARRARRELDRRTLERVRSMLSEDQRARLPERQPRRLRQGGGESGIFIEQVEIIAE